MKKKNPACRSGPFGLCLLIALLWSCGAEHREMPITTTSDEARKLFIEGRELYENLHEDEARELFYAALEKDQDFALCHYYLALAASSAIEYSTHLKLSVQLAANASEGERLLIESLRARAENNAVAGIEKLKELVQLYPQDKRAHRMLGYLYRGVEEEKAIAEYEKAIQLAKNYAPAYNNLGYAYQRKGEFEKAIDAFKKYSDLLPDEANPHDSIAELYKKMGKYKDSIDHYKMALERKSTFAFSHRSIGENLIYLGNFDEARYMFEKVQNLDVTPSKKADALQMIAHSYVYEEELDKALAACDRAIQFAGEHNLPEWQATLLLDKAMIYLEMSASLQALSDVKKCRQIVAQSDLTEADKDNFVQDALYCESQIAIERMEFDHALALAEMLKARIDAGNDPQEIERYHNLRGAIHAAQEDHNKAIQHFTNAMTDDPHSLYLWAKCEGMRGNRDEEYAKYAEIMALNESSLQYAFIRPKVQRTLQSGKAN